MSADQHWEHEGFQEYLHGPLHPEFSAEADVAEVYRAMEDGTLSYADGLRIVRAIDDAPNPAAIEDIMSTEFYKGETSPDPDSYHTPTTA